VAATEAGTAEFVVLDVADGGRTITPSAYLTACGVQPNLPNDILAIGPAPSPTVTPTASPAVPPTPSPTPTASPTSTTTTTPSPSPTPPPTSTTTPTPTPTRTATPVPAPLYLPVALRERCAPDKHRADVALVLDASSSMDEPTPPGASKLDAARDAARILVGLLLAQPGNQAAPVTFNHDATLAQPLTADRAALDASLAGVTTALETCLVCGVQTGADDLPSARHLPGNAPVLLLLTDGLSNAHPADEAVAAAGLAKERGVVIYTVGLGDVLDFAALRAIASADAYCYHAPDAGQLAGVYRAIAADIPCPVSAFWGRR
jgi:Mg-chelatase subunit ChlD